MFNYTNPINKFSRNASVKLYAKALDGLHSYTFEYEKKNNRLNNRCYINFNSEFLRDSSDLKYLLYPDEWSVSEDPNKVIYNNSISVGFDNNYKRKIGAGVNSIKLRTSALYSCYNFSTISYTNINRKTFKKLTLKTRAFIQYGFGDDIANESSLYLAGANPEEMTNNKFTRAAGYVDNTWLGYSADVNHFQEGGGLNLRGYAGYLVPDYGGNENIYVYKGSSGAAFNAELE